MFKTFGRKVLAVAPLAGVAGVSMAEGPDYSGITSAVDVSTVTLAIIAMAALKVGPNVAKWAGNKLASFFR